MVIRESAAEAVRACLQLVYQRDSPQRAQWYGKTYEEVQKGQPRARACARSTLWPAHGGGQVLMPGPNHLAVPYVLGPPRMWPIHALTGPS